MIRGPDKVGTGFTLTELVLTIAMLVILTGIAIQRMGWSTMDKADCRTCAHEFGNYLRLARSLAITKAGSNSKGYKVIMSESEPYIYMIINANTSDVVNEPVDIPEGVECTGDREFYFEPLGGLKGNSELTLQFSKSGETAVVRVTPIGRITVAQ